MGTEWAGDGDPRASYQSQSQTMAAWSGDLSLPRPKYWNLSLAFSKSQFPFQCSGHRKRAGLDTRSLRALEL